MHILSWVFTYSTDNKVYTIDYPCKTSIRAGITRKIKKYVIAEAEMRFDTRSIVHKSKTSSYTITKQPTYTMNGVTYDSIASMINKSVPDVRTMSGIIIRML
jgi:hypothetical protein